MKRIVVCLLSVLLLTALMPCLFVLYEVCWEIRPGMTRADLLTVFRTEGGVRSPTHGTYVYRHLEPPSISKYWRFIKVDVDFEVVKQKDERLVELPTDRIIHISKPYFEGGIYD